MGRWYLFSCVVFFFQAEDGIRDLTVTGVQTCALPIYFCSGSATDMVPIFLSQVGILDCSLSWARAAEPVAVKAANKMSGAQKRGCGRNPIMFVSSVRKRASCLRKLESCISPWCVRIVRDLVAGRGARVQVAARLQRASGRGPCHRRPSSEDRCNVDPRDAGQRLAVRAVEEEDVII